MVKNMETMIKKEEVYFGLITNYEACFSEASIAVSVGPIVKGCLYDQYVADRIEGFPTWLEEGRESETTFAVDDSLGYTLECIKEKLTDLGFTYKPEWDYDYGEG